MTFAWWTTLKSFPCSTGTFRRTSKVRFVPTAVSATLREHSAARTLDFVGGGAMPQTGPRSPNASQTVSASAFHVVQIRD
jgi:hypothetical protein